MSKKIDGNTLVTIVEACRLVRVAQSYKVREPDKNNSRSDLQQDAAQIYARAASMMSTTPDDLIKKPVQAITGVISRVSKATGIDYSWMRNPCIEGIERYERTNVGLTPGQLLLLESGRSVDELTADLSLKTRYQRKTKDEPKFEGEPDQDE